MEHPMQAQEAEENNEKYLEKWNWWSMKLKGRKCLCHKEVLAYKL